MSDLTNKEALIQKALMLAEDARKSGEEASNASNVAQMVVLNVRMVSGMMGELASGMGALTQNVSISCTHADDVVLQSGKTAECLDKLMKNLSTVASSAQRIRGIAAQTNMLALNATIAAAHAGEHGREFSVVASEVKALANQTAETTANIDSQLTAIRTEAAQLGTSLSQVSDSLMEIRKGIESILSAIQQQNDSFFVMNSYANEAASSVEEIAGTLEQAASIEQSMVNEITELCALLEKQILE